MFTELRTGSILEYGDISFICNLIYLQIDLLPNTEFHAITTIPSNKYCCFPT